ncbi:ABC transporter substrate-binding protein [Nesterenkonia ebinurensis]|uniref:ABC transporter substrate-binding protein n=1 Tax=Nesterenkonia ebinurensis TaxID=2608252 RepID=UPI00168B080F|nr:ABC transporter substrate-binding protein [Nesterenkonia ebinurensis]
MGAGAFAVACGGNGGGAVGDGEIAGNVRFAWWGNAHRQELYAPFAQGFEDVEPDVSIQLEPAEYSPYLDRISVQAGGRNLPDTFWIPANQATSFADADVLLDLNELPDDIINFNEMPSDLVSSWEINGRQVAPVYTQYSPAVQIDRTAFEEAGITDLPDDESWSWEDFWDLAQEYSDATEEGNWGISSMGAFYQHAHLWIRQQGGEIFGGGGNLVLDPDILAGWFAMWQSAIDRGAVMPPQVSGSETQWTQTGHRTGLYLVQLNQYLDNVSFSSDHDLDLFKYPEDSDSTDDYQFHYHIRMCVARSADNPEAAAAFLNYFLNDESAAEMVGLATGFPVNPSVIERIEQDADEAEQRMLDMQARVDEQPMRDRPEPPPAGAGWQQLIENANDNIFNGGQDIDDAVAAGIQDLEQQLERG